MNRSRSFPNTRWTRVVCASDPSHPRAKSALAELFQLYWYPIYAFIRRTGYSDQDAEDLAQSFFLYAYDHGTLQRADPAKGRFRTFVLACLKHFLSDAHRFRTAAKRGGQHQMIEIDGLAAEARYAAEPVDHRSPEHLFEQKLALEVLHGAMRELEAECADDGKAEIFAAVRGYLDDDESVESYRAISARLNIPVGTLKSHVHRLRERLRRLLIERVDHIVASEDDVKAELVALEESL
jgi:RNA polymerase sigma factor (sigma-70 family)